MKGDADPDVVLILMRPDSTFDERKAAIAKLAIEAWERGWDECDEAFREALTVAGLTLHLPVARA